MTRGGVIAHRLYLSAMVVLVTLGVAVVAYVVFAFFHDERVTQEDRACFEREVAAAERARYESELAEAEEVAAAERARYESELAEAEEVAAAERAQYAKLPPLPPGAKLDPPAIKKPLRRISRAEADALLKSGALTEKPPASDWRSRATVVSDWRLQPTLMSEACHFSIADYPKGRSSRTWLNITGPEAALSVFAFIPAVLLWGLARWIRWLLKPVAP